MRFPTTRWNLLSETGRDDSIQGRAALEALCGRYWGPIHAYIRSRSIPDPEAQDLTQDFMVHLVQGSFFARGDPLRGRFRSFLLGALVRFLADAADKRTALKRGGAQPHLSLDHPELVGLEEVSCPPDSAWVFDHEWALTILESAYARVEKDYTEPGRAPMFEMLKHFLLGTAEVPSYAEAASELGISVAALKAELHRLRLRFRRMVREEVAQTISAPHELEAELIHLRQVLTDPDCAPLPDARSEAA